jgi:hypothetical protein
MRISHNIAHILFAAVALGALAVTVAAQPGTPLPPTSGMSDQKPGSVLFYPYYSSHVVWPQQENTKINITNTHTSQSVYAHMFFVDSGTCQSADTFVCLTANQTFTFVISDYDPGITGYLLVVAVDGATGLPIQFNHLTGDYYLKLLSGHSANLGAEAFAALKTSPAPLNTDGSTADVKFDDVNYNAGPRVLMLNNIPSRLDGNDTVLLLTRLGGNLAGGEAGYIGGVLGLTYDDVEKGYSFTLSAGKCQYRTSLTDSTPRMVPRFTTIIKAGQSGWMKLWPTADVSVVGVMLNLNPGSNNSVRAYSGGHNLHTLTTTTTGVFTIPVFMPTC